jgi:hypothetical protein
MFYIFLIPLLFLGCSGNSSSSTTLIKESEPEENISIRNSAYWGSWINVEDATDQLYITTEKIEIETVAENVIKVDETVYLRQSSRNVNLSGNIFFDNSYFEEKELKDFVDAVGVEMILRNILDENIFATVVTDENGTFKNSSLPAGVYTASVNSKFGYLDLELDLKREDEYLDLQLAESNAPNFQATFQTNADFLYSGGEQYDGTVTVKNIGSVRAEGVEIRVSIEGATVDQDYLTRPLGSEESRETLVHLKFPKQSENAKDYNLTVKIKDDDNREWVQYIPIRVHKDNFKLHIESVSDLKGVLYYPNSDEVFLLNSRNFSMELPLQKEDTPYILAIVNSVEGGETYYGIGADNNNINLTSPDKNIGSGSLEPNDKLSYAYILSLGEVQHSYISLNDIDYWKIATEESGSMQVSEEGEANSTFLRVDVEYSRNSNGVVSNGRGLEWEDYKENLFFGTLEFAEKYCEELTLDRKSDWRVPTFKELWYLSDRDIGIPTIDKEFHFLKDEFFWSNQLVTYSGLHNETGSKAWVVSGYEGFDDWREKEEEAFVRCVRGVSSYEDLTFQRDDKNSIVLDTTHNLYWIDEVEVNSGDFEYAKEFCDKRTFGGRDDWKLPTIEELQSIANQKRSERPFVDSIFENIRYDNWYWSSTPVSDNENYRWKISFNDGSSSDDGFVSNSLYILCVTE